MSSATEKKRTEFAERVVRLLEAGIVPWQRDSLPDTPVQSALSGRNYGGLNALYLMETCAEKGYADSRFITASEANKNGVHIRKGEQGTALEHWTKGEDGKIKVRGYTVFNVQQLNGTLPISETPVKPDLDTVTRMLNNAGTDISLISISSPESGTSEYRDAIKAITVKMAEEAGYTRDVHTPELLALRYNIASTVLMRETGIPVEQAEGLPTQSWAKSIKHDPSQLYKATRDGYNIADAVMREITQERESHLFQAGEQRSEAQRGQELVSEAATVPRGLDSNLPHADLSPVQESVIAASAKAAAQVSDLRASASAHEISAQSTGTNRLTEAKEAVKKHLGESAIVTSAQPGRSYQGQIIGVFGNGPDKTAIQVISDNRAILHDIRDISAKSNLEIGKEVNLVTDAEGYSTVQGRDLKQAKKEGKSTDLKREGFRH